MQDHARSAGLRLLFLFAIVAMGSFWYPGHALAAMMSAQRDLIVDSAPSASTTHQISFTVTSQIPLGGSLVLTFENTTGAPFVLPAGFDHSFIDLSVATSGPYVERELGGEVGSTTSDYVSVTQNGGSQVINFTLGDASQGAVPAGANILVLIGTNATYGGQGADSIENPAIVGSYRVRLASYTAGGAQIDYGGTMIAIVRPVSMGPVDTTDIVPPLRYDGRPFSTSTLLGSTFAVQVSVRTDKLATCRYMTVPGVDYQSMTATMTAVSLGLLHFFTLSPVMASTTYNYYIRCMNSSHHENTDDYPITFKVAGIVTPGSATSTTPTAPVYNPPGPVPAPPGSSSFSGPGPAGGPYLGTGDVTIDGDAYPGATIVYLKDGQDVAEEQTDSSGHFTKTFSQLERGTYTWGTYARDPDGGTSATYASTIFLIASTNNIIAPIYLSPTVFATTSVGVGDDLQVVGHAIAKKAVKLIMVKYGDASAGEVITSTTTANPDGTYQYLLPTSKLSKGTYEIRAQSIISMVDESLPSLPFYVGIGESPNVDFRLRADLNKDGKVNLVDFSILLFNWKTADPVADINLDGTVNLTDLSIMLTYWTG